MNEFLQMIKNRKSQRTFLDKPVEREHIEQIIECARFAATARNVQPWEFIVITGKETKERMAELAPNGGFMARASVCIAVFCQDTKYYLEDGCAATENILLAATALGLGSCWVAGDKKPYTEDIRRMLSVPADYRLVSLIALGYPEQQIAPPVKRSLSEVLHWEKF